jgi:zinc/manganese transport system substrate-binding protein/manganese/iron transport system substrate-binding protein
VDGRPRVVATTTQVGSLASEIGGDAIDLTVLMEPGIEAHDFELTPEAGAALEEADVILVSGAGLEEWLSDALATIGGAEKVRDLSENAELRGSDGSTSQIDPHYWLSGPNAVVMTGNVQRAITEVVPAAAEEVDARATALIGRLEAADAEVRELIGEIPAERRKMVTDHDALGYFIDEYGLTFVGSVFPTMDVASEPSARDIEALVAKVRAEGVTAIFTESSVDPRLARAVAEETGARIVDEPIYTDSLGAEGSGAETLDRMLLHNARVIRDGLLGS